MLVSAQVPITHHHSNQTGTVMNGGLVVLGGVGVGCPSSGHFMGGGGGNSVNLICGGVVGVEPVQAIIWHCLNNYAYADACFLAERVHAEYPSDESLHSLATAYYRSGSKTKAYVLLSTTQLKSPQQLTSKNRYLLALVCYELEKYAEAESMLLKSLKHDGKSQSQIIEQLERAYGDISSFALKLYALICVQTERSNIANEAFGRCLKLNPFLWNAYEYICRLGGATKGKENSGKIGEDGKVKGKGHSQQRVFQLPDSAPPSQSNPSTAPSQQQQILPSSYLPNIIGSTAASLILNQDAPKGYYCSEMQSANPHHHHHHISQNNQNYYNKDNSLNLNLNTSTSSIFLNSGGGNSAGVLHPSNRNNIKPSKRNLFTSTPMGGGGPGVGRESFGSGNNYGPIPLHLMMDSSSSIVNNSTTSVTLHHHHQLAGNANNIATTASPIIGVVGGTSSVVHSPIIGDYTDELGVGGGVVQQSAGNSGSEQPRAKKPCLRTPWQQQVTSSSVQHHQSTSSTPQTQQQPPQTTVTISTSSTHQLRRSSRLHHHHSHHTHLKENNKQTSILSTPPSSNVNTVITPDNGNQGGSQSRRSGSKKSSSSGGSVLKPKLRLNNRGNNNNERGGSGGGSSSSTSTVTGEFARETSPSNKDKDASAGGSLLEGTADFYRAVMEKTERDDEGRDSVINRLTDLKVKFQGAEERVAALIEAFRNGVDPLLHILSNLSTPYTSQNVYSCVAAINQYQRLKPSQYETGWVYGNIARCYFELGNYEECIKFYKRMMEVEPWRTEGLEWLSTAYWHLQKETELSALAQDLMKSNRTNEVATWVAAGNCFSLHKEHETAIKFFKRAIQVNRYCAYAYTLLGHEYVVTEELEKAMRCFRSATRIDCSHYNAWYGMGMIFYKQERFERAEVYYRKALYIHPNNSVLLCHLGVVQHALGKPERSLDTFKRALESNKHDPLCKFHRASVLFGIGKLDEALDELEELKEIVPKESLVYFLIAKIFSKQGKTHKALLHFSWATDLDPKGANNQIKESIEPVLSRVNNNTAAPGAALLTTANSTAMDQSERDDEDEDEDDDDDGGADDDESEEDGGDEAEAQLPNNNNTSDGSVDPQQQVNNSRVVTRNMRGNSSSGATHNNRS